MVSPDPAKTRLHKLGDLLVSHKHAKFPAILSKQQMKTHAETSSTR